MAAQCWVNFHEKPGIMESELAWISSSKFPIQTDAIGSFSDPGIGLWLLPGMDCDHVPLGTFLGACYFVL